MASFNTLHGFTPRVFLFSPFNHFSAALYRKLNEKGCHVVIVSEDEIRWRKFCDKKDCYLPKKFEADLASQKINKIDYIVSFSDNPLFQKTNLEEQKINLALKTAEKKGSKILFIFPYLSKLKTHKLWSFWSKRILAEKQVFAGVIYLGELIDSNFPASLNNRIQETLKDLHNTGGKLNYKEGSVFYPLPIEKAASAIISSLFSMSAYGITTAYLSSPLTEKKLTHFLIRYNFSFDTNRSGEDWLRAEGVKEIRYIEENPMSVIKKTLHNIGKKTKTHPQFKAELSKTREISLKESSAYKSRVSKKEKTLNFFSQVLFKLKLSIFEKRFLVSSFLIFLVFLLLSPTCIFLSFLGLRASRFFLEKGYVGVSKNLVMFSRNLSSFSKNYSFTLMEKPILGSSFKEMYQISFVLEKNSELGFKFSEIIEKTILLIENASKNDTKNNARYLNQISLDLDSIYSGLGFLQSEVSDKKSKLDDLFVNAYFHEAKFSELREKAILLKKIVDEGENIFGKDTPKTYLILLQDSSVIRPTGGRISAFAIIKLTNGIISQLEVFPINSNGVNLPGEVELPQPLKKHFNLGGWNFSDSNWYADFPSSAEKAEWFLDKEFDIPVDGVVAINTKAINAILVSLGKKELLFQGEEKSFVKDFSYFLSLLQNENQKNKTKIVFRSANLLIEKDILVFSHNVVVRDALAEMGWDGSFGDTSCNGCYLDTIALVEASRGRGSENILREAGLKVSIEEGIIKKNLSYYLENTNDFDYKTYLRLVVNPDSGFSPAYVFWEDSKEEKNPEVYGFKGYKEAGVYVELAPHETKAVVFNWESGIDTKLFYNQNYYLFIRKQPGVTRYPVKISINPPERRGYITDLPFSLTDEGVLVYNTTLSRDFISRIFWKK